MLALVEKVPQVDHSFCGLDAGLGTRKHDPGELIELKGIRKSDQLEAFDGAAS